MVQGCKHKTGNPHFWCRDDYRKETERRLEEAARRKEAADKEKAAQRYHRKEYK